MNTDVIMQYAPKALTMLAGLGLVYAIRRHNRKNDATTWLRKIYASAEKASKDENYRQSELADVNRILAGYPAPAPITPITTKVQTRLAGFPKMMFMTGLTGVVSIYLGLFETGPAGSPWPLYGGIAFLVLCGAFYWMTENMRPGVRRVQELNRKYLLQKAGKDAERFETLKEIIEYYPGVAELRLELGDQCAVDNRLDEAVAAVKKARELAPEHPDFPLVEASFHLRRQDAAAAVKALDAAEQTKRADSDPRVAIYRAAAALQKNEKKSAARYGEEAKDLDRDFTEKLLAKDPGLKDLAAFLEGNEG